MSNRHLAGLTIALVAAALLGATFMTAAAAEKAPAAKKPPPKPKLAAVGEAAPHFALWDQDGKYVSLSDLAEKIVVLEWINPDCPISRRFYTNGTMKRLASKYAPKGVVWLAINSTHYFTQEKNEAWVEKYKLPYPILDDAAGRVAHLYTAKTTPDMRIIDKTGKLVYSGAIDDKGRGESATNYVEKALDELLAGKEVSANQTRAYGCSVKYAKRPKFAKKGPAELGKPAPDFALADHTGSILRLSDFGTRIVVLEWINPDCPVSKGFYTNGTMKRLASKYGPKGVVWLAINTTHYFTQKRNKAWAEKYKLPFPILDDAPGNVGHTYGAKTTPDMRIIDKTGKLVYSGAIDNKGRGESATNYVAKALDELLAGKKVSVDQTRPYGCSVKYAKKR